MTDFIEELAALAEKAHEAGKGSAAVGIPEDLELAAFVIEHRHAILAFGRERDSLRDAALGLQKDLLERAEWCPDAGKVVCAGNGAWFRFCQALEGDKPNAA